MRFFNLRDRIFFLCLTNYRFICLVIKMLCCSCLKVFNDVIPLYTHSMLLLSPDTLLKVTSFNQYCLYFNLHKLLIKKVLVNLATVATSTIDIVTEFRINRPCSKFIAYSDIANSHIKLSRVSSFSVLGSVSTFICLRH